MQKLSFVRQFEKYSPKVNVGAGADTLTLFLDFPVVLQDIQGAKKRLRYDEVLVEKVGLFEPRRNPGAVCKDSDRGSDGKCFFDYRYMDNQGWSYSD